MFTRLIPIRLQAFDSKLALSLQRGALSPRSNFQFRSMSNTTSHIFVVWAPDDEAPGTFEKRMSVREEHAARAKSDPSVRKLAPLCLEVQIT